MWLYSFHNELSFQVTQGASSMLRFSYPPLLSLFLFSLLFMIMGIWKRKLYCHNFLNLRNLPHFSFHRKVLSMVSCTGSAYALSDRKLSALCHSGYFSFTLLLLSDNQRWDPSQKWSTVSSLPAQACNFSYSQNHLQAWAELMSASGGTPSLLQHYPQ